MKARDTDKKWRNIAQIGEHNRKIQIAADAFEKEHNPPQFDEVRTEYVCVDIPDETPLREVPAVASALYYYKESAEGIKAKAWASQRKNYTLALTVNMYLACDNPAITEILTRTLEYPVFARSDVKHPSDYDMYCRIDSKVMSDMRSMGKYHAAAAYGIVVGTEAYSLFPISIDKIVSGIPEESVDILVIEDAYFNYEKVWQWLGEAVPMLRVSRASENMNSFRAMLGAINKAQLVVGPASLYTYLACCMGRPTFEIYPKDVPRNWLSKWDNKLYGRYVCDIKDVEKERLLKGVAYLWQKTLLSKQQQVLGTVPGQTQMEQSQLDAGSAITL